MPRPKKPEETKRIRLSTTVAPATMKNLKDAAKTYGSLGLAIDKWASKK